MQKSFLLFILNLFCALDLRVRFILPKETSKDKMPCSQKAFEDGFYDVT